MEITGTRLGQSRAQSGQLAKTNTAVLGLSELNRIKQSLADTQGFGTKDADRKKLKAISDSRVQHWPNTVHALREKKENERFEKFKREELERRRIDQEEAAYQAEEKKKLMDVSKLEVFRRHDKVKKLHSTMLYSDVLQERELQKEITKHKQQVQSEREKEHHIAVLENVKRLEEEEQRKIEEFQAKKKVQQTILRAQHEEFREKHIQKMRENALEGEIIKAKAKEAEIVAKKEEQERKRKILMAQAETKKANDHLNIIKDQQKQKELLEEQKIVEYAKKREEIVLARKAKQEQIFQEKQAVRQKMIDKAVEEMKKRRDDEDKLVNKHIEEERIKAERTEEIKREKKAKLKAAIDKHSNIYMNNREAQSKLNKDDDKAFQQFWKDKNTKIEARMAEDKKNRTEMKRGLAEYQVKQMNEKNRKREEELILEMQEAESIKKALEDDEKVYRSYAERCVNEWSANGKSVAPLIIELKKQRAQNLSNNMQCKSQDPHRDYQDMFDQFKRKGQATYDKIHNG